MGLHLPIVIYPTGSPEVPFLLAPYVIPHVYNAANLR